MKLHKYFISILCTAICIALLYKHAFADEQGHEVLKVKGLYIGMNIDEACIVVQKLLTIHSLEVSKCVEVDCSVEGMLRNDLKLRVAMKDYLSGTPRERKAKIHQSYIDGGIESMDREVYLNWSSLTSSFSDEDLQVMLSAVEGSMPDEEKVTGYKIRYSPTTHSTTTIVESGVDKKVTSISLTHEEVNKLFNTGDLTMDQFTQAFMNAYQIPKMEHDVSSELFGDIILRGESWSFTSSFGYKVIISKTTSSNPFYSDDYSMKIIKIAKKSDHTFN